MWFVNLRFKRTIGPRLVNGCRKCRHPLLLPRRTTVTIGGNYSPLFSREQTMKRSLGAKTLIFPTPTWIVGSYDKQGKPNGMTAAWGGICCSDPPCVAVSLRKATYSYGNLVERKAFTVSVPSQAK